MSIGPSLFAFWVLYGLLGIGVFSPGAANGTVEVWLIVGLFIALGSAIALAVTTHFRKKAEQFSLVNCTLDDAGKVLLQVRNNPNGAWLVHSSVDGELVKRAIAPRELPLFQARDLPCRLGECWRIYTIDGQTRTIACQNI